jgi:hypothetical protein
VLTARPALSPAVICHPEALIDLCYTSSSQVPIHTQAYERASNNLPTHPPLLALSMYGPLDCRAWGVSGTLSKACQSSLVLTFFAGHRNKVSSIGCIQHSHPITSRLTCLNHTIGSPFPVSPLSLKRLAHVQFLHSWKWLCPSQLLCHSSHFTRRLRTLKHVFSMFLASSLPSP